jgi:hypothetical protein
MQASQRSTPALARHGCRGVSEKKLKQLRRSGMEYKQSWEIPRHRATGRERLERLAVFLEQLSDRHVSFDSWRTCAVGLAANDPWFLAQGLALQHDDRRDEWRPAYAGRTDWIAVSKFFEISVGESRQLLDSSGYDGEMRSGRTSMIEKIRRHLAAAPVAA